MRKKFYEKILKKIELEENFIINKNKDVLNFLESNKVGNMYTFDFENLYTSLPHELLDVCRYLYENYLTDYDLDRSFWIKFYLDTLMIC